MPARPFRPCRAPGCNALTRDKKGFCPGHAETLKNQTRREADKYRESASSRGYDWQWQKVRAIKLAQDPACAMCGHPADTVHHDQPIETHPELRLYMDNLVSLCFQHHEQLHGRLKMSDGPQKIFG